MPIPVLTQPAQFDLVFRHANLLVVCFTASWCGPCQQIAPILDRLSANYTNVTFLKVDVDDHKPIARRFNVTSIPTFLTVRNGSELEKVRGADVTRVAAEVQKLSALDPGAERYLIGSGSGEGEGESSGLEIGVVEKYVPNGFSVLNNGVFLNEIEALNVENAQNARVLFENKEADDGADGIHSDIDSQLLLHVPLINIAKVYSILVKSSEVKEEEYQRPNLLKIWINNNNIISFEDAISLKSLNDSEEINEFDENGWAEIKLKYVRFQKVKSLDLFFDGEDEDLKTRIEKIVLVGVDGESAKQGTIPKE